MSDRTNTKLLETLRATKNELLYAWRKREEITQKEMAARLGISRVTLGRYEAGEALPKAIEDQVTLTQSDLHDYEKCVILRRRGELTQSALSMIIGVSRWWFVQMECGKANSERLVEYWETNAVVEA